MGYIGKAHQSTSVPARTVSMLTGDGAATTLDLSQEPLSASNVSVFFDGVAQTPGTDFTLSGSQLTFTSAPPTACVVCAIVGGGENISSPMDGSITAESIVAGAITNAKIASVSASKLTGAAFPALDASNVTFGVQQNLFTKSAADPTETSNVSLGTIWINTLSGEIFVCVSDVNNKNSFMNVGTGTTSVLGNVTPGEPTDNVPDMVEETAVSHTFTGGTDTDGTVTHYHVDQISDVNLLSVAAAEVAAGSPHVFTTFPVSSDTDVTFRVRTKDNEGAYSNGITVTVSVTVAPPTFQGSIAGFIPGGDSMSSIEKLSFAAGQGSTAVTHGDLTGHRQHGSGSSSLTHGYVAAGYGGGPTTNIQKFAFVSNVTATNVGNLSTGKYYNDGCTDVLGQTGYSCAGTDAVGPTNWSEKIESFSFSSNTVNSGFGTLVAKNIGSTHSSTTHGFCAAGFWGTMASPNTYSTIDKFSFASGGAVSGHGNLFGGHKTLAGGASSATEGFEFGGQHINSTVYLCEKFSFASNTTGSLWGDLWQNAAGNTCAVSGETFAFVKHGPGGPNVSKYVYANDVVSIDWMDLVVGRATGGTSQY